MWDSEIYKNLSFSQVASPFPSSPFPSLIYDPWTNSVGPFYRFLHTYDFLLFLSNYCFHSQPSSSFKAIGFFQPNLFNSFFLKFLLRFWWNFSTFFFLLFVVLLGQSCFCWLLGLLRLLNLFYPHALILGLYNFTFLFCHSLLFSSFQDYTL